MTDGRSLRVTSSPPGNGLGNWPSSPGLPSTTVGTYLDDVAGVEEYTSGDAEEISGIQVIDDTTLQVTIDDARSYFLSKLSHPVAFVVDQNQIEDNQGSAIPWWAEPNGTGPFKLISWEPSRVMVLQANDEFTEERLRYPTWFIGCTAVCRV